MSDLDRAEYVDFDGPRAAFDVLLALQRDRDLREQWRPLLDVALNTRDWEALAVSCSVDAACRARTFGESVPAGHVAIQLDGAEGRLRVDSNAIAHRQRQITGLRALGEPEPGREAHIARMRAMIAVAADVRMAGEMVAETETAWLGRFSWSGHMDEGGGAFETPFLTVVVIDDELVTRLELFALDDEQGAWRRWDELAGRATTTPCDQPGATRVIRARTASEAMWRDLLTTGPDEQVHGELLEGDDEVAILRNEVGTTTVAIARDGVIVRAEVFEDDADLAMLRARAEDLRPLARRRPGADMPREPLAVEGLFMRLFAALEEAGNGGPWDAFRRLLARDMRIVDHRLVSTVGDEVRDADAFVALQQALAPSGYAMTRRLEVLAASERRAAGVHTTRGLLVDGDGPFEISSCVIGEWHGGLAWQAEFFDVDDEAAMLARFAELEQEEPAVPPPPPPT